YLPSRRAQDLLYPRFGLERIEIGKALGEVRFCGGDAHRLHPVRRPAQLVSKRPSEKLVAAESAGLEQRLELVVLEQRPRRAGGVAFVMGDLQGAIDTVERNGEGPRNRLPPEPENHHPCGVAACEDFEQRPVERSIARVAGQADTCLPLPAHSLDALESVVPALDVRRRLERLDGDRSQPLELSPAGADVLQQLSRALPPERFRRLRRKIEVRAIVEVI